MEIRIVNESGCYFVLVDDVVMYTSYDKQKAEDYMKQLLRLGGYEYGKQ